MVSYWTLSGTLENWRVALEKGVWGVSEKARALWAKVQPGDIVAFYATGTGVIGYGTVESKFESGELLWPKEKEEGKVIWPYRIKIRVEKVRARPLILNSYLSKTKYENEDRGRRGLFSSLSSAFSHELIQPSKHPSFTARSTSLPPRLPQL